MRIDLFFFCHVQALHFNTFGGNPMASAVGIAVLETMEQEKTMQNSKEVGTYLLQKLVHLVDRWVHL